MGLAKVLELARGVGLVVPHVNADLDAVACAMLVAEAAGIPISCPGGVSLEARSALARFGLELDCKGFEDRGVAVYVDAASFAQVPRATRYVVVDHHADPDPEFVKGAEAYVRYDTPSCTEGVLGDLLAMGVRPRRELLALSIYAIYRETGGLRRATPDTLRVLASALELLGSQLGDVVSSSDEVRREEVIARIKGLKRLMAWEGDLGIICATHVSAFESSVANLLIAAGCDVAIVASAKDDGVHLILRGKGLDRVYDVLRESGGVGGGHGGAGGFVLNVSARKRDLPALLRRIVARLGAKRAIA